jgi:hypothetical protein
VSYESENTLPKETRLETVCEFLQLLGYERFKGRHPLRRPNVIDFGWFSTSHYESNVGVELHLRRTETGELIVYTRTPLARSYHDLLQQNRTIREIRRRFGGNFETDAGRNRCWCTKGISSPIPAARGVRRAYSRLRYSLFQIAVYRQSISIAPERKKISGVEWIDSLNPSVLSNNLLLPFLTAALEDFFKSSFVALLRYSERKETFFKNARLNASHLTGISDGKLTVEEAIAQALPFQRISSICDHFKALDSALDLASCLKRPYRRRSVSLFESIEKMVEKRHELIHRNTLASDYSDELAEHDINNVEVATKRCILKMNNHYAWNLSKFDLNL